ASSAWRRAARAATPRERATPPRSRSFLRDARQDAVDEPARVVRRVALRQVDRLADRHLDGDRTASELVHANPQDVPLDDARAGGVPALGALAEAPVERRGAADDSRGELERERLDLALVERRERPLREVPLVEQEKRRPARRAAPAGHYDTSS